MAALLRGKNSKALIFESKLHRSKLRHSSELTGIHHLNTSRVGSLWRIGLIMAIWELHATVTPDFPDRTDSETASFIPHPTADTPRYLLKYNKEVYS